MGHSTASLYNVFSSHCRRSRRICRSVFGGCVILLLQLDALRGLVVVVVSFLAVETVEADADACGTGRVGAAAAVTNGSGASARPFSFFPR